MVSVVIFGSVAVLFLVCAGSCQDESTPTPTPMDQITILVRNEMNNMVVNTRGGDEIMPVQLKRLKCQILNALYRSARTKYPNMRNDRLPKNMVDMLRNCSSRDFRAADMARQQFMFPGTKWCGQGNVAVNYHELGVFNETDACCREHDFCDDIIRPGHSKHNIVNPYGTTRLHCRCDEALRKCFQKTDSIISNAVGYIFFSLLQTQCFDFNHPTSSCIEWKRGAVRLYCVKYKLEVEEPKKWQWFDQEPYI